MNGNDSWKEDLNLREKLRDYVTEGLHCEEILNVKGFRLPCLEHKNFR